MPKYLKIDPGQEVVVEVINPTPDAGTNRFGRAEYSYTLRHAGEEKVLSASEKLHEDIQAEVGPLKPGMLFSINREGKGKDTRWSVATQRGGAPEGPRGQTRHLAEDPPVNVAMNRQAARNYATLRDQYLGVLYDVHTTLAAELSEEFANQHAQAVAATIYINANREGVPLPYREGPSDSNGDAPVPREDTPREPALEERLQNARIWLHELMGRAGAHPTQHDELLQYLAKFDEQGNPPTFDSLTLEEFQGIAAITHNGRDLAVIKQALENMQGSGEGMETPF